MLERDASPAPDSVVFVFDDLPDWQQLAEVAGAQGHEVAILDGRADGLRQMAEWLQGREGVDALYLLSHGRPGVLQLGSLSLDQEALTTHADALARIGSALSEEGDILPYGCDVAAGELGQAFVQALSSLTGADVAASTDLTGSARLGGNWALESQTGLVQASADWAQYLQQYASVLALQTITLDGTVTSGSLNSGSFTINGLQYLVESASGFTVTSENGGLRFQENAAAGDFSITITDPGANSQFMAKSLFIRNNSTGGDPGFGAQGHFTVYDGGDYKTSISLPLYQGSDIAYLTDTLTAGGNAYIGTRVVITDTEINGVANLSNFFIKYVEADLDATNTPVDTTAPRVNSITRQTPSGATTNADSLTFAVAFSEAVQNVDAADFSVTGATASVSNVMSAGGNTYHVTVSGGNLAGYNGSVGLTLAGGHNIQDVAGNALTNTAPTGNNHTYTLDNTAPTVTSVSATNNNGSYKVSDVIAITVTFSEAVNVTGTPQLTLETGTTDRTVNYASGSATNTLTFNYTVQPGDATADLDYLSTTALTLNSGTITDGVNNAAVLTLPAPGDPGSLGHNKSIAIDGVAPQPTGVTAVPVNGIYAAGQNLDFSVTFSEAVTVTGTPYIALTLGTGGTVQAAYQSGSGGNTLTFRYTVAAGNQDADGIAVANAITLNSGTVRDAAGNNATLTGLSFATTTNVLVDGVAPTVTSITRAGATTPTNADSVQYTVTFSESVAGVDSGDFAPVVAGTVTSSGGVTNVSGSGTTYTVTVGGITGDGALRLDLNASGTGITDLAGNAIGGGYTSGEVFVVDNTAPGTPVIVTPAESSVTNATPTVTGTAEANSSVLVFANGNTVGTVTADGSGNWSITVTAGSALAEGPASMTAWATDAAGNTSSAGSRAFTIDATPPTAPTIALAGASDTGASDSDGITSDDTPTLSGTAEANSTVEVFANSVSQGTVAANGAGEWFWTPATPLAPLGYTFTARATDAVGNTSTPSSDLTVTIDTTAPAAPVVTSPVDGNITNNTTPMLAGTAEAHSTVEVFAGAASQGTATADSLGNWSLTVPSALAEGAYSLTAKATDTAGNASTASMTVSVTIDTTPPATTVDSVAFSADSGSDGTDFVTNQAAQTISGTLSANLMAGESVQVSSDDGTSWATATASVGSNTWSLAGQTLTASDILRARVMDAAGNAGMALSQVYVLDTTDPSFNPATGNTPADDAINVSITNDIVLAFSEPLAAVDASKVYLRDVATDNLVPAAITINGSGALVINPNASLAYSQAYYVTWDVGALEDLAGNAAALVADKTTYNFTTEAEPPAPEPEPAPAPIVDGVPVVTQPGPGGTTVITIPVVLPTRPDDPSTPHAALADIPLVKGTDGHPIVQVSVPVGVGLTAQGLPNPVSGNAALAELGLRLERVAGNDAELTNNGQVFFASLDPSEPLTVQTITATAGAGFNPNTPFVITGSPAAGDGKQAIILDARSLPSGTLMQVDNVDFLAVVGAVRIIGGAGQNIASGDSASQWIVLGADDDVLHGGGGNDVVGSKGGNDRLYGDDGNDFIVGGSGDDHLEGGAGNDVLQGGASDAGAWSFALNADGTLQARYSASQPLLTEVHGAALSGLWSGGQLLDERIALAFQDYGQLEVVSLLFQGLAGALPTLQDMNLLSIQGWSRAETLQAAWGWFESTLPASASTLDKLAALIGQTWGTQAATAENVQVGLDYLAQGGTWTGALDFLVNHASVRQAITHDGALQLTQAAPLGEMGWGADSGNDTLLGGAGNDVLIGGGGNDVLDGGEGTDLAVFFGTLEQFSFELRTVGGQQEVLLKSQLLGEQDILRGIEFLQIGRQAYRLDLTGLQEETSYALAHHVQAVSRAELVLVGLPDF